LKQSPSDVAIAAGHTDAGDSGAMFNLGVLAKEAGDLKGEKSWYELAAAAGNSDAINNLGVLANRAGDLKGAKRWFERAK